MANHETIAALATPAGHGGVGIVRVSGPSAQHIAEAILESCPAARFAHYGEFLDAQGHVIDIGIALYFPGPHSFTGEDVLELQGHGGPVIMDMLLLRVVELGARLARPGEFSERAFLNDKMDLSQAEAIADLIECNSVSAAQAAVRSLQGEFSQQINLLAGDMIALRCYVEAAIDFPEEEIDFLSEGNVRQQLQQIIDDVSQLMASAQQGCLMREGMTVVIAGQPNAGKSSLLNQLAARDSAIVTDIPGTTRDVLRETINLDGLPLHVIDTAGLRDGADQVEQEGIRRAWQEIEKADRIILLLDDGKGMNSESQHILDRLPKDIPCTLVYNKIDLSGHSAAVEDDHVYLSAKTGEGIDGLRQHLKDCVHFTQNSEGNFIARRRHIDALQRSLDILRNGMTQLQASNAGELLAEDLRHAHESLTTITGEYRSDDLLGEIFGSFCIGK